MDEHLAIESNYLTLMRGATASRPKRTHRPNEEVDVVIKYTKDGVPAYIAPPYTAAEKEQLRRGLNDTPTVVGRYRKPQGQQQHQPQQGVQRPREGEQP